MFTQSRNPPVKGGGHNKTSAAAHRTHLGALRESCAELISIAPPPSSVCRAPRNPCAPHKNRPSTAPLDIFVVPHPLLPKRKILSTSSAGHMPLRACQAMRNMWSCGREHEAARGAPSPSPRSRRACRRRRGVAPTTAPKGRGAPTQHACGATSWPHALQRGTHSGGYGLRSLCTTAPKRRTRCTSTRRARLSRVT